ncbi:MAG TPA: phytoene/squalene synthase family protein [Chitinophagaceae bacterium]|nr:phytoene/squalene synthase family protein [Chitinophagaceae bacterium]
MKQLFDTVSVSTSKLITKTYSTSFSLGIHCLHRKFHDAIYSIYGFVRCADEIVDSFHDYEKASLLEEFKQETWKAIERKISLNPVLNSFQSVVVQYGIERELIECFLQSMAMDLGLDTHDRASYCTYILGSAEVVGLMCLRVFTEGDESLYEQLKPGAMKLGAAFQKVNFLRDLKADYADLGRIYFPAVNMARFSEQDKAAIELEIQQDFDEALAAIRQLPVSSRFGVYVAYVYYKALFAKIKALPSASVMQERVRINNYKKMSLLAGSYLKHSFGVL